MENRIDSTFAARKAEGRKAFIAYITAGDPSADATVDIVLALEAAGVDIVELGVPFSDPLADGVVNQLAAQRALEAGMTTAGVFEVVRKIRARSQIPLVLFTYLNPVYARGFERFHAEAEDAGVDGLLLLDLPPDEAPRNPELRRAGGLRHIGLIAPTTPVDRMRRIAESAEGFLYYITREGVTGVSSSLAGNLDERVAAIRDSGSGLPVCVGFGISTPDQVRTAARAADGVIVGSAIVEVIARHGTSGSVAENVQKFVNPLVKAITSI